MTTVGLPGSAFIPNDAYPRATLWSPENSIVNLDAWLDSVNSAAGAD